MTLAPVELWVYDLSHGMASAWGHMLTGTRVDGIWHTSIVVHDLEVFYGQGISIMKPGTTHHGQPVKRLAMGSTGIDKDTFLEYIHAQRHNWTAQAYHLLDNNCNNFTNEVLEFLNDSRTPQHILDLPRTIMQTPFGQQMRPMIDNMFRGTTRPDAQDAVNSFLPSVASAATDELHHRQSGKSTNLQTCSDEASLRNILKQSRAVVVMYTSVTCPPCHAIKPHLEQLAREHDTPSRRIQFAIVDINVGSGPQIARSNEFGGPVQATPTFALFAKGNKTSEVKGADKGELTTQVRLLEMQVWPPHPHSRIALPEIQALSRQLAPITYISFPSLPTLQTKLDQALSTSSLSPESRDVLSSQTIKYLSDLPQSQPPTTPIDSEYVSNWSRATLEALESINQPSNVFAILDCHRLALARDSERLGSSKMTTYDQFLKSLVNKVNDDNKLSSCQDKAFNLTLIRLLSNFLLSKELTTKLLFNKFEFGDKQGRVRDGVVQICVRGLLSQESSVRTCAAGLSWSVVAKVYEARDNGQRDGGEEEEDEEFVIELTSALVESLGRERDGQVVHRLVASIGLLLYKSPHAETIKSLLEVLNFETVLNEKREIVEGEKDRDKVVKLIDELRKLVKTSDK
ncbi:hypothetical protein ACM66B_003189 [Microbotryomycetes sp. NB124-2]